MKPKPDIILFQNHDLKFSATKRHFLSLMKNYSHPIFALNLTKEFNAREAKVAEEYKHAVLDVINQDLPSSLKINYIHYDVKSRKK